MKKTPILLVISLVVLTIQFKLLAQELPDITPPSPTVFELTKYGDVPINETSGKVTASIPIYNFKAGNITVPISLNYTGAGVKVDQAASWTGINWNLNAGGVISRVVKDIPDEYSIGANIGNRKLYGSADLDAMDLSLNSQDSQDLNDIESQSIYDTQADHFSFSFLNYSGSFYLDENFEPQVANLEQELDVEFFGGVQNNTNGTQTIIITTPDGVKYYFGGTNNCEQTRTLNSGSPVSTFYTTAYYLYQIVHPFGDIVTFEYAGETNYTNGNPFEVKLSEYEQYIETPSPGAGTNNCSSPPSTGYSSSEIFNRMYNGKYLNKITTNRGSTEVRFISSDNGAQYPHFKRQLNEIWVENTTNTVINQKIRLKYETDTTRFFLEEVEFFEGTFTNKKYEYILEYNDPLGLPDRFSNAKDYLGYYNGKTANQTLLPTNNSPYFQSISGFSSLADRNPDSTYAVKGSLSKIYYPTGGYTAFEYELPSVKADHTESVTLDVYSSLCDMDPNACPNPDTQLTDSKGLTASPQSGNTIVGLYKDQDIVFNLSAIAQGNINTHYKIYVDILDYDISTTVPIETIERFLEPNVYDYYWTFTRSFIKGKNYTIKLRLDPDSASTSNPEPVDVDLNFNYIDDYEIKDGLGVRVKRVKDFVDDIQTTPSQSKTYFYNKIEDVNDPNIVPEQGDISSTFIFGSKHVSCCFNSGDQLWWQDITYLKTLKSEGINSIFPATDGITYDNVTTSYGGDNFENGGLEKTFLNSGDLYTQVYHNVDLDGDSFSLKTYETEKSNRNIFNGKVVAEKYILNKNNTLYLNKENTYTYHTNRTDTINNMIIQRMYDVCVYSPPEDNHNSIRGLYIGFYATYSNKISLNTTLEKTYTEPVPITDLVNANNYASVSTTTDYEYDSFIGQPTKVTTSTSISGETIETKHYYVDQVGQLSGLTSNQIAACNTLETMHRITDVIHSETSKIVGNNTPQLLSTQRTLFKNWNGGGLVLPEIIQAAKGNDDLKDRIRFYDYTTYGNLLEASKEDGSRVRYMYNALSQVIRKIENYDTSISSPAIGTTGDVTLCTAQNTHPNSLVSVYDYIGGTDYISSVTDPRCNTMYYEYDEFFRLKYVKDKDGNILSKNEYNFKTQN